MKQLIDTQVNDKPQIDGAWERSDSAMYQRSGYGNTVNESVASAVTPASGYLQVSIPGSLRIEYDGD